MKVEYRVRPITRYVVTRYIEEGNTGSSEQRGTYDNAATAYEVGYALCRMEQDKSGEPVASMNFIYPTIPDGVVALADGAFTSVDCPPANADDMTSFIRS